MKESTPQPLWREVVGDPEPWRRGRLLLGGFALLMIALQSFLLFDAISVGEIDVVLILASNAAFFWLQFYFIWIGVHWVRLLLGIWNMITGFCLLIWGWRDSNGLQAFLGIAILVVGVYLCLSPSIYFFANRQKDRRNLIESIVVGLVFFLILSLLSTGTFELFTYKARLAAEAHEFADNSFRHIFNQHDTYFLMDHMSEKLRAEGGGQLHLTQFLQDATIRAGDVVGLQPAVGTIHFQYTFPALLEARGVMATTGKASNGNAEFYLRLVQNENGWQVDAVSWSYPRLAPPTHF